MTRRTRRARRYFGRLRRRGAKDKRFSILTGIPAVWKGLVEPIFGNPGWTGAAEPAKSGDIAEAARQFVGIEMDNWTGYNINTGQFNFMTPISTYGMLLAGYVGSKLATRVGANKAIKNVPIVGRYIKL